MNLHCTWREWTSQGMECCQKPATVCVVYGCLEGHLNEIVACDDHYILWADLVDNNQEPCHRNGCRGNIDTWRRVGISELTSGFKTYMMTRQ